MGNIRVCSILLAAALCLALVGCGGPRVLNAGATIEIRTQSTARLAKEYPQFTQLGAVSDFRWNRTVVILPNDVSDDVLIRLTLHEFIRHVMPRMAPETEPACRRLLDLLSTDAFQPITCAPKRAP